MIYALPTNLGKGEVERSNRSGSTTALSPACAKSQILKPEPSSVAGSRLRIIDIAVEGPTHVLNSMVQERLIGARDVTRDVR